MRQIAASLEHRFYKAASRAGAGWLVSNSYSSDNQLRVHEPTGSIVIAGFDVHSPGSLTDSHRKPDASICTKVARRRAPESVLIGHYPRAAGRAPPKPLMSTGDRLASNNGLGEA